MNIWLVTTGEYSDTTIDTAWDSHMKAYTRAKRVDERGKYLIANIVGPFEINPDRNTEIQCRFPGDVERDWQSE